MVLMQRKDFEGLQKITFNEIIQVQKCMTDADEQSFEMTIKDNSMKIIRCESKEDCEQVLRCLLIILKMRDIDLDFAKISVWTFEKFYNEQT